MSTAKIFKIYNRNNDKPTVIFEGTFNSFKEAWNNEGR